MAFLLLVGLALAAPACGGAPGGAGRGGSGQGLIVLSFLQEGFDNLSLNEILRFDFSEDLDEATVNPSSLQIREGPDFGRSVPGTLRVVGATVFFEPTLPGLCDLSDGAMKSDRTYRIQLIGYPEEFAIRNLHGQALRDTVTFEVHTRDENDPNRFIDAIPAAGPADATASPDKGDIAVEVAPGNAAVFTMTENLDPCTVNDQTVRVHFYQTGGLNINVPVDGRFSGFSDDGTNTGDPADQDMADVTNWGAVGSTTLPTPQKILATIQLVQSFASTEIRVVPSAGLWPENALVVIRLSFDIEDFGGTPLLPYEMSFTTENLPQQDGTYVMENAGETAFDDAGTTADVNTARSPSLIQAFLLFSGDGDNGANQLAPTLPQSDTGCTADYQTNDMTPDDFDPASDVLMDTGATVNLCPNATDGSLAVVWEFKTFTIRNGVDVRFLGSNPAIILVQGEVFIENGARLLVRGENQAGSPRGAGEGNKNATTTAGCAGGVGVAGGGDGGASPSGSSSSARKGGHGLQGYFHTSTTSGPDGSIGSDTGVGSGHGQMSAHWTTQTNPNNRNAAAGGGGGHVGSGGDGDAGGTGTTPTSQDTPLDGVGGGEYGDDTGKLGTPEAGSGGGAGGEVRPFSGTAGRGPGGGGGAGGGFIDLTCGGDMTILGTLDAAGSTGGSNPGGNFNPNYSWQPGVGGGGGGSGGGIRLLTPSDMIFGSTTVITAAGGKGGVGGDSQAGGPPRNNGGDGASGRIAIEDGNSVVDNLSSASVTPGEGDDGFYRAPFDATRFKGGGTSPQALTEPFAVGPLNPTYLNPVQSYGGQEDFIAGIPVATSPGGGRTAILIQARGYKMLPDGMPDLTGVIAAPTGWYTVGHFTDSTVENRPDWRLTPPNATQLPGGPPPDTAGTGIGNVSGFEYLQIRIKLYISSAAGATDPGAFLDRWVVRFTSDQ